MNEGIHIHITGMVQGVGFRPWVWKTATRLGLCGTVRNSLDGVRIELYGDVEPFLKQLHADPPPLSRIESIRIESCICPEVPEGFRILESETTGDVRLRISPDIAICEDCRRELFDPDDRRHRYPFINCVNCGPRFSIIENLPYDRPRTSMHKFDMCPACRAEYTDPADRRYHAQPIACPECGPSMAPDHWEAVWRASMEQGDIVVVKGIGGFHLACDALNPDAVSALRQRKRREAKPFALMVPDLNWVRSVCAVSPEEEKLLYSRERPIVLLKLKAAFPASELIAPGLDTLGIMLPYSPMHEIMFAVFPHPVVMTSANYSSEPMIHTNTAARRKLADLADTFIVHDREIVNRCEDSVCAVFGGRTVILRPGRGLAPLSMPAPHSSGVTVRQDPDDAAAPCVLAFGADLKNTFALMHRDQLTLHPFIGDLEHPETQEILEHAVAQQLECFKLEPDLVVHDLHPDYFSTRMAQRYAAANGIPVQAVQHHHAHLAGAHPGPAIGFAFDGTGYGTDGTIWGGEVLFYDTDGFSREFHLRPFALPGGDAAVKHPMRTLVSLLSHADRPVPSRFENDECIAAALAILESGINCPETSSMGRLFDAVSVLLGLCDQPTYDGEAAIRLEAAADEHESGDLAFSMAGDEIDWRPLMADLVEALDRGVPASILSARFHNTVAEIVYCVGRRLTDRLGRYPWVLAGGVFQNRFLVERIRQVVGDEFDLVFSDYPNDSGVSIGQAIIGAEQWALK